MAPLTGREASFSPKGITYDWGGYIVGKREVRALPIKHPSTGFSSPKWHSVIQKFLSLPRDSGDGQWVGKASTHLYHYPAPAPPLRCLYNVGTDTPTAVATSRADIPDPTNFRAAESFSPVILGGRLVYDDTTP